jgi:hypothetical protein
MRNTLDRRRRRRHPGVEQLRARGQLAAHRRDDRGHGVVDDDRAAAAARPRAVDQAHRPKHVAKGMGRWLGDAAAAEHGQVDHRAVADDGAARAHAAARDQRDPQHVVAARRARPTKRSRRLLLPHRQAAARRRRADVDRPVPEVDRRRRGARAPSRSPTRPCSTARAAGRSRTRRASSAPAGRC